MSRITDRKRIELCKERQLVYVGIPIDFKDLNKKAKKEARKAIDAELRKTGRVRGRGKR